MMPTRTRSLRLRRAGAIVASALLLVVGHQCLQLRAYED